MATITASTMEKTRGPTSPPLKKRSVALKKEPPINESMFDWIKRVEGGDRTYQNPRERTRTVPMEVLVIGMCRTGTMSMKAALRHLGYKCYHMSSVVSNPPDAYMWAEAMRYKATGKGRPFTREDFDHLLGETQCCLDAPTALFMPELIKAYPEAKIIVVERDVDKWFTSMENTVFKTVPRWWELPLMLLDFEFFVPWASMMQYMNALFNGNLADPVKSKPAYRAYYEEVRGLVPEGERRLEYHLGDGWGPLCKFLEREPPKGVGFPHLNESADFLKCQAYTNGKAWKRVRWTVVKFLLWLGLVAVVASGPLMLLRKEIYASSTNI